MGLGPGTVHKGCGRRMTRTIRNGRPALVCGCGYVKLAGTMVERGVRIAVPWEQTEKEANRG